MSTGFVTIVPPPRNALREYNPTLPPSKQPSSIPPAFLDAMYVREEVFVQEQNVPLANELDDDDPRCWHWVAYASVGTSARARSNGSNGPSETETDKDKVEEQARKASAAKVPVATIRLVPPPHEPHPVPGSKMVFDSRTGNAVWTMPTPEEAAAQPEAARSKGESHGPEEPYIKLGRLATSPPFRGLGLSKLVINAALAWAANHPHEILPPLSPTSREAARLAEEKADGVDTRPMDGWHGREEGWRGLVLVHAQTSVEKVWAKFGFVRDESLGTWWEEGIEHIGMWRKLTVKEESTVDPLSPKWKT
ncbi:hypothetical protein NA57DRAFT_70867 [Rhizodiscina lignyota]|uniref:Uncharacterized protein n=1 Tax=Rhizodiscina lignyota TaxID=1504668 RepID=A0A9P4INB4_9PEZI|nr:hypothetical protein NA57DRAFT_70867 [Rhizodiscina lignyota]